MNMKTISRLMAILPDGPKKRELVKKYEKLQAASSKSTKRGGDGLHDSFEFKPTGHIKIEAINESGEVVGTLADQPNLVVDGAEEILLRAFSGDANRILYKNRIPKTSPTGKYHIDESLLAGYDLFDGSQILHDPNVFWSAVNDEDFEVSYGYYPVTVYVKEEVSTELNKKAFVISETPAAGFAPLNAEVYSTSTNMFIGIGEGTSYPVSLNDARLTYSEDFVLEDGKAVTSTEGHEISFKEKISNFSIEFEASDKGAQIDVFVNGTLQETIETLDSDLDAPEVRKFDYKDLNLEEETEVRIVHSGSDSAVTDPQMVITGIHFDALHKGMNGLMQEFKNFETDFLTPTIYNTTPMGPYTIQLPHFPIQEGSVVVTYNDIEFTQVESEDQLHDTAFLVDDFHGVLRFNRALSGVFVSYSVTGEIYDTELVATMTSETVVEEVKTGVPVTGETLGGAVDGANKVFDTANSDLVADTVKVYKDGVEIAQDDIQSISLVDGRVTLKDAPSIGEVITADYTYVQTSVNNKTANAYDVEFTIEEGSVKIIDNHGKELTQATDEKDFGDGKFLLDEHNDKRILIAVNNVDGDTISSIKVVYRSEERPGVPTGYARAVIEKPKTINEYPWFELDSGSVRFIAEFPELTPAYNITIREMGLFDGPRPEDEVAGFKNFPVKAFSLVRVGDTRKDMSTGIRITWTITLINNDGLAFKGGDN